MNSIGQAERSEVAAIKTLVSGNLRRCVVDDEGSHAKISGRICTIVDSWSGRPEVRHTGLREIPGQTAEILVSL